ncbi:non-ribosomal peptide synthetase [Streptomyces diastaticus]|uniref:non-ribosomal peptide synthetase n=1 Tax=Streptomyces diastaticus TaxID=1956 RepID=UPI00364D3CBC
MTDVQQAPAEETSGAGTRVVPLAPTQRRMWLLEQLVPGRVEYNVVDSWALAGPVDLTALEAAVHDVTQRHEALRTTFHLEDGEPVQRVHPKSGAGLHVVPGVLDEDAGKEWMEAFARTPFSLTHAPLIRWALITTAPDRHLLQLVAHHLVVDGWSLEILLGDLSLCYTSRIRGEAPQLPDVPTSYGDYAGRAAARREAAGQMSHWKDVLQDLPAPPRLPLLEPGAVDRPARQLLPVEAELAARIKQVAQAEGVTPSALWLTCFAAVLSRWSGTRDVVVGSPLSGRTEADLLQTVGFFIATVALRLEVPEGATGRDVLARAHQVLIEAQLNQDVPFDEVVAAVRPQRRADAAPPFSAWFNVLSYPTAPLRLGTATGERLPAPVAGSPFGLSLYVDERRDDAMRLDLVHDTARLETPYAKTLLKHMLVLARELAHDVTAVLDAIPLADTAAPDALATSPTAQTMAQRLRGHPGDALAIVDDEGRWTYGELLAAADDVEARLRRSGLLPGELVEITEAYGRRLAAAVLGVWQCGGVFFLTDPGHPAAWRTNLREQARPRFVLTWQEQAPLIEESGLPGRKPAQRVESEVRTGSGHPLYLLSTSGTTREPRLVLGGVQPLLTYLAWWSQRYEISPEDRFCVLSGLSHDPLLRDLFLPLWNGGVLTVPPSDHRLDPARIVAWLDTHRVTVVHLTPLVGRFVAEAAMRGGTRLEHMRLICFGGDTLTNASVSGWRAIAPGARLVSIYGTTETPQAASCVEVPPGEISTEPSLGHGAVDARLAVLTHAGIPAAPGEVGEIVVRSPSLTLGYLDDGRAAKTVYEPDPWGDPRQAVIRTGDIGRLQWDGSVAFLGRGATMVKVRGHRVSLSHLAAELRAVPGVADAAAVQRDTGDGEVRTVAYVVQEPGTATEPEHVLEALAHAVPSGFLPDDICVLESLPLTPNGKLDARRLPAPGTVPAPVRPAVAAPGAGSGKVANERVIASVWQEVLGIPRVDPDDNFFDLGGTSITAVLLRTRLESKLQRSLPPLLVFQSSSVRRMADSLTAPATGVRRPAPSTAHGGERALRRAARAALTWEGTKR